MQNFAAERIDHTDRAIEHSAHDRVVKPATHALVNQGDVEITGYQFAVAIFDLAWVGDDAFDALRAEILGEEHKFAVARHLAPVENGDTRLFAVPCPLQV